MSFMGGPTVPDDLHDIKGIPLDHFWRKCVENLPADWWLTLQAIPAEDGKLMFQATAIMPEGPIDKRPYFTSQACRHPERALEQLFYQLRDFL